MSATKEDWKKFKEASPTSNDEDLESAYSEIFGRLFYKGLDIGRQVVAKLEGNESETDRLWPTLLQAEAMDSGLSAGYLNVCGICVIGEVSPFVDLSRLLSKKYGTTVSVEKIETQEELVEKYPDYETIPYEQQWSLPAVMIHYGIEHNQQLMLPEA